MHSHARNYRTGAAALPDSKNDRTPAASFKPPRPAVTAISVPTAFGADPHTDRNGHRTANHDSRFSPRTRYAPVSQPSRRPLTSFQARAPAAASPSYRATPPAAPRLFSGRTERIVSAYAMDECAPYDARAEAAREAQARLSPFVSAGEARNGARQAFHTERRRTDGCDSDSESIRYKPSRSYGDNNQYVFDNDRQVRIKQQQTRDKQKSERALQKEKQLALTPAYQADEKKRAANKLERLRAEGPSTVGKPLKRRNAVDENISTNSSGAASVKSSRRRSPTSQKAEEVLGFLGPEKCAASSRTKLSQKVDSDDDVLSLSSSPVKGPTPASRKVKKKHRKKLRQHSDDELSEYATAPMRISLSPSPAPAALVPKPKVVYDLATLLAEEDASVKVEVKWLKRARKMKRSEIKDDVDTSDSDSGQSDADRQLVHQEMRIRRENQASPDPLLEGEDELPDPSTLCPFCSSVLPSEPSKELSSLKKYLLGRPNVTPNPSKRNPLGKRLPVVETASFCRRHRWETSVIPEGKARGWPTTIDWEALPKRVGAREFSDHLSQIIMQRKPSRFFDIAKREWEAKGSKINNILSEFKSSEVELPGYYGLIGQEKLIHLLNKLFVVDAPLLTTYKALPLDVSAYIRRVLVPETAVELIRRDLELDLGDPDTRGEAERVCQESREFGQAMFSTTQKEEKEMRANVLDEQRQKSRKKEKEKEKELQRRKEKAKKETQRRKKEIQARALRNALRLQRGGSVDLGEDSSSAVGMPNGTASDTETTRAKRKPRAALHREQQLANSNGRSTAAPAEAANLPVRGSSGDSDDTDSDQELMVPLFETSERISLETTSPPKRIPRKKLDLGLRGKKRRLGEEEGPAVVTLEESSDDLNTD
ncbi:hypothetical protein MVLG_06120 [Microbotryum lychnidis-dioicae p1A1 Lamole]|uniref:Restriction of telomere capping protein 4 n=1 Tax=Microbotryum lychnidis-dioicae (strain p1A1 Lamole / MvSl-1064) TaxID=683840 RepID=U5HGA9_USTV1|nr:hypothetical protein MVLG_06120 [Microbotryum lychnidis-dioicae p1A1 Lamole]|eukprot:KDE03404.1 hypothetical protein MVLG_06120 [Microbotryum lychnidis-dioicae p1A1 Lamole]